MAQWSKLSCTGGMEATRSLGTPQPMSTKPSPFPAGWALHRIGVRLGFWSHDLVEATALGPPADNVRPTCPSRNMSAAGEAKVMLSPRRSGVHCSSRYPPTCGTKEEDAWRNEGWCGTQWAVGVLSSVPARGLGVMVLVRGLRLGVQIGDKRVLRLSSVFPPPRRVRSDGQRGVADRASLTIRRAAVARAAGIVTATSFLCVQSATHSPRCSMRRVPLTTLGTLRSIACIF